MHPKIKRMYERMPEVLTNRFEEIDEYEDGEEGSLVLQHKNVNMNLELATITEYPTGQLRARANLYAPLAEIETPEEGIETLTTLRDLEQRLHNEGFNGKFGHYDEGVEFTYDFEVGGMISLQRVLREFAFIQYNQELYVTILPKTSEQATAIKEKLGHYLVGERGIPCTSYSDRNPSIKIANSYLGSHIHLRFWAEDEQTLRATQDDIRQMHKDVANLHGDLHGEFKLIPKYSD